MDKHLHRLSRFWFNLVDILRNAQKITLLSSRLRYSFYRIRGYIALLVLSQFIQCRKLFLCRVEHCLVLRDVDCWRLLLRAFFSWHNNGWESLLTPDQRNSTSAGVRVLLHIRVKRLSLSSIYSNVADSAHRTVGCQHTLFCLAELVYWSLFLANICLFLATLGDVIRNFWHAKKPSEL